MKIICSWCKKFLGHKPGEGVTHGICDKCYKEWIKNES